MDDQTEQKEMNARSGGMAPMVLIGVIVVLALVGGFVVLSGRSSGSADSNMEATTGDAMTETDTQVLPPESGTSLEGTDATNDTTLDATATEGQTLNIDAGAFYYSVKEIRARKGETITINLTAVDMQHDFNIDELGVDSDVVKDGESIRFSFVASEAGEFEYYCSVGQHRQNGQVGTLIVTE